MQVVASFDPSLSASGQITIAQSSGAGKLVFYNESNVALILSFQNGGSAYLPAWVATIYCGNFGGQVVRWAQQSVIASLLAPISLVIIEAYGAQECILNIFPATLVRQTNVGNSIKTAVVGTSTLVNDGNAAATQFIEATVLGDGASAVSLTNDAIFKLGTAAHPGSVSFDNALITSNGAGTLTAAHISSTTPIDSLGGLPGASGVTTRFGKGLHGSTDAGFESATFAVVAGEQGALFKQNNYFDGSNHRYMTGGATAYQFDFGGAVSFITGAVAVRSSTNSSVANAIITWTAWSNIAGSAATSINNTGNAAGTSILASTVSGDGTPAVNLNNDGTLTIGNGTHPGSVSFDNAKITSDGSGNLTVQNLVGKGAFAYGEATAVQTLTNNATVTVSSVAACNQVTAAGTITGLKMPVGTVAGQVCVLFNHSTNSLTFADHSTSNVINGTGTTIGGFRAQILIWNPSDSNQWYAV